MKKYYVSLSPLIVTKSTSIIILKKSYVTLSPLIVGLILYYITYKYFPEEKRNLVDYPRPDKPRLVSIFRKIARKKPAKIAIIQNCYNWFFF